VSLAKALQPLGSGCPLQSFFRPRKNPNRKKKDFHFHPSRKSEGFADSIENNRKSNEAKPESQNKFSPIPLKIIEKHYYYVQPHRNIVFVKYYTQRFSQSEKTNVCLCFYVVIFH
jgi:hypothetical protein